MPGLGIEVLPLKKLLLDLGCMSDCVLGCLAGFLGWLVWLGCLAVGWRCWLGWLALLVGLADRWVAGLPGRRMGKVV